MRDLNRVLNGSTRSPSLRALTLCNISVAALAVCLNLFVSSATYGQLPARVRLPISEFDLPGQEPADDLQRLHSDRRVVRQLDELSLAASRGESAEVRDFIEILRGADPLLMVQRPGSTFAVSVCLAPNGTVAPLMWFIQEPSMSFIPLHRDLVLRIQSFTVEMQGALRQDNAVAEVKLHQILTNNSHSDLIAFLQGYAGTVASLQAHLLLATIHADRGHNLAAEYWLAPLLTNERDPNLRSAAEKLQSKLAFMRQKAKPNSSAAVIDDATTPQGEPKPAVEPPVDDKSPIAVNAQKADATAIGIFSADSPDEGLRATESQADVATEKNVADKESDSGKAAKDRTHSTPIKTPTARYVHWMNSLPLPANVRKRSRELVRESPQLGIVPWSAWQPEIDDRHVYVRTPHLISAYDRHTGKHIWTRTILTEKPYYEAPVDDIPLMPVLMSPNNANKDLNSSEIQLAHRNEIVGRMTSDSERLFAVCQTGEPMAVSPEDRNFRIRQILGRSKNLGLGLWELIAVDKSTGRRMWTQGGQPVEEKLGNELAMFWFAGPPAVSGDDLFQVVEKDATVQFCCLRAATGQLLWKLPLVYPDLDISQDDSRQVLAAQIHVEAGIAFITTTNGWVCCVDTLTRSVLWARRLLNRTDASPLVRSFRTATYLQSSMTPFGQAWRSRPPILASNKLIVTNTGSTSLIFLDPRNGQSLAPVVEPGDSLNPLAMVLRLPRESANSLETLVLYADKDLLVTASAATLRAVSLPDLEPIWTLNARNRAVCPVGPAVRSGYEIFVAMTDGAIDVVNLKNGRLTGSLQHLRPPFSSGGLYPCGNDMISYGPDHLALLSNVPADHTDDPDRLQKAIFLVEIGKLDDARVTLSKVESHALNKDAIRRLRFRIALGTLASKMATQVSDLEEIASLATTPPEIAISQVLRLDFLMKSSPESAGPALIAALETDVAVQKIDIPDVDSIQKLLNRSTTEDPLAISTMKSGAGTRHLPFRAWLLQQLGSTMTNAGDERRKELILSLAGLSDEIVLEIHSRPLAWEYLRRAEAHLAGGTFKEATFQLLMAAADFREDSSSGTEAVQSPFAAQLLSAFDKALEVTEANSEQNTTRLMMLRQLLQVVRFESMNRVISVAVSPPTDLRKDVAERWSSENESPMRMLPVSTVGQAAFRTPTTVPVDTLTDGDLFLRAFHWSLRGSPGTLMCQPIGDSDQSAWELKFSGSETANFQTEDEVCRFGSVLVYQNMTGLSGFSITDHRWLWTRRMPGGTSRRIAAMMNEPFRDFNSTTNIQTMAGFGRRIIGGSPRWICLKTENGMEVIDAFTGNRLWAIDELQATNNIAVSDSALCISSFGMDGSRLNPLDGHTMNFAPSGWFRARSTGKTIRGAGDTLAVWNSKSMVHGALAFQWMRQSIAGCSILDSYKSGPSIAWMHPITDRLIREIPLQNLEYAQFLDSETLAYVTNQQSLCTLNLVTGEFRTLLLTNSQEPIGTTIELSKISVTADAVNYYVYQKSNDMPQVMYGLRAEQVQNEVRAISRRTGQLAWVQPVNDSTLTCFDGAESVMLFIRSSGKPRANAGVIPRLPIQAGQKYVIDAVSRTTGAKRFSYSVVSQYPMPNVQLSHRAGMFDLEAFGNRVRFLPEATTVSP